MSLCNDFSADRVNQNSIITQAAPSVQSCEMRKSRFSPVAPNCHQKLKKKYTLRSKLKSMCVRQIWREIYSRALCISEMKSVEGPR